MKLPDWIDEPVPHAEVDGYDDAVGKLIIATQEVEAWLAFVAHRLGATASATDAARLRATQLVVKIRQRVELVPEEDHDDLRSVLRRTSALLDFRNTVVDAMPRRFDAEPDPQYRLRPPPPEHFPVGVLVGAALVGDAVTDYFHAKVGSWTWSQPTS